MLYTLRSQNHTSYTAGQAGAFEYEETSLTRAKLDALAMVEGRKRNQRGERREVVTITCTNNEGQMERQFKVDADGIVKL